MPTLKFSKMHGLGNDFMVIDATRQTFDTANAPIREWADRHTGVGFGYRIFNADGSEVEQCGNGARCFVKFVTEQGLTDKQEIVVQTAKGIIKPRLNDDGLVTVNMGQPRFAPEDVPFVLRSGEQVGAVSYIVVKDLDSAEMSLVNMGNPHAVMWVGNVDDAPVESWGAALQNHQRFPQKVNVGFMQVIDKNHIKLRVYERGAGETQACGTGACAAVVAGVRLGAVASGEWVRVVLPGGELQISWEEGSDVMMMGPAVTVFSGELTY